MDKVDKLKLFTPTGEARLTRQSADPHNLKVPRARLEIRKYSFAHRVVPQWNRLASEAKECTTLAAFKNALKKPKTIPG